MGWGCGQFIRGRSVGPHLTPLNIPKAHTNFNFLPFAAYFKLTDLLAKVRTACCLIWGGVVGNLFWVDQQRPHPTPLDIPQKAHKSFIFFGLLWSLFCSCFACCSSPPPLDPPWTHACRSLRATQELEEGIYCITDPQFCKTLRAKRQGLGASVTCIRRHFWSCKFGLWSPGIWRCVEKTQFGKKLCVRVSS